MTEMTYRTFPTNEAMTRIQAAIEEQAESAGVPMDTILKISLALDEIFANLVDYSGADDVCVVCRTGDGPVDITFTDNGPPFDPLSLKDPDITPEGLEERTGGLGIYIYKKLMDEVSYRYENGTNILRIRKK